jgi:hypothetical protein
MNFNKEIMEIGELGFPTYRLQLKIIFIRWLNSISTVNFL